MADKEPFDDPSETHAKCDDCLRTQEKDGAVTESKFPSQRLLEKTIQFWQPCSQEKLTLEDAREIIQNTTNLIYLLDKLDRKYGEAPTKTKPPASSP